MKRILEDIKETTASIMGEQIEDEDVLENDEKKNNE